MRLGQGNDKIEETLCVSGENSWYIFSKCEGDMCKIQGKIVTLEHLS